MSDDDVPPAQLDLLEVLERSEAQARAGLSVPLEEVLAEFDAELATYEAERAARENAVDRVHSTAP